MLGSADVVEAGRLSGLARTCCRRRALAFVQPIL
jgi:hypothetical protein